MRDIRVSFVLVGLLLAATIAPGCRRGREVVPPLTYPVKGKVIFPGGKIAEGYLIQFESGDPKCMAEGLIASDGTFELVTRYEGVLCKGAAEGQYHVTIMPPLLPDAAFSAPKRLPKPVQIKPEPNELTISLGAR